MKITLTAPGGQPFLLADDSVVVVVGTNFAAGAGGQIKEGFVNKQKRLAQRAALFRAAYAANIPRYNLANRFSFLVQRSFSTVENCLAFIAFHPDNVPIQGEVAIDNQSTTGRIYRYLPNAVVESVECVQNIGLSCNIQYVISGDGAWQTQA